MKPVTELINELKALDREELDIQRRRGELLKAIEDSDSESWDWVSVRDASRIVGMSVGYIYTKINSGSLETRHLGRCVFVRKSQVMSIDDKYAI